MAAGTKECFYLLVLHFGRMYLRPDGSSRRRFGRCRFRYWNSDGIFPEWGDLVKLEGHWKDKTKYACQLDSSVLKKTAFNTSVPGLFLSLTPLKSLTMLLFSSTTLLWEETMFLKVDSSSVKSQILKWLKKKKKVQFIRKHQVRPSF